MRLMTYVGCLLFVFSLILNVYLIILLAVGGISTGNMSKQVLREGHSNQVVAVYSVNGIIDDEASAKFARFYREVHGDKHVQAIVLHVDSPGGTVSDSEQIHHMIKKLQAAGKKIVVSMGGVAASGGYLISAPAEEIFAIPSTITGSIGVIAQVPNVEGTMEKLGLKMLVFKSTHARGWKDQLSIFRMPERRERKWLIEILDVLQAGFEKTVRDGRGKRLVEKKEFYFTTVGKGKDARQVKIEETAPFNGKVYLAAEAMKFGLVDKIGFLDDACNRAAELAGLDEPRILHYKTRPKLFGQLFGSRTSLLEIAPKTLDEFQTPRILMLWKMD